MNLRRAKETFSSWMDVVSATLVNLVEHVRRPRTVRLIEQGSGRFKVEMSRRRGTRPSEHELRIVDGSVESGVAAETAKGIRGCRIELVLQPTRFLFRPLELPKRATEFLDGIVRGQIDRLTPWSARDAAFGWAPPRAVGPERISVTVAATAQALVRPYLRALTEIGAASILVSTRVPAAGEDAVPVTVLRQSASSTRIAERLRRVLSLTLIVMALSAGFATVTCQLMTGSLEAELQDLSRQIAETRAAMFRNGAASAPGLRLLEQRKRETPASVIVIEALSQILPDDTYVTELRIENDRLQVVGISHDAPSLIRLLEQSPHFNRATFFAPTTRSPEDPGERFHIEARIKPVFELGS
jgi:general secretion pathway protein L